MTDSSHGSLYSISCSTPALRRITSEEPATGWFNITSPPKPKYRERFACQYRFEPPPTFLLTSPFSAFFKIFRFLTRMLSLKLLTLKVTVV